MSCHRFQKAWQAALRGVTATFPVKEVAVWIAVVASCVAPSAVSGASCKPDSSSQDRITKQRVDQWNQVLSSSGFLSAALLDNDVTFTAYIKRIGDHNFVMISIEKVEESMARAAFESHYHGSKGDQLLFGFKNGDPLSFVVTEVANQAQADMLGKLHMSVFWAAELSGNELGTMRDALTTKQIDAIRITQAAGQVEEAVPDKSGKRLMEKFGCFYEALTKDGVDLSAGSRVSPAGAGAPATSANSSEGTRAEPAYVEGRYLRKGKSPDFIELGHGKFSLLQDGHNVDGTYVVDGDKLTMTSPRIRRPAIAQFVSHNAIKDESGTLWEKQGEPAKPAAQLTIGQVIQMVGAKLADDIIITTIQNSRSTFDLTPEALIKLKGAGVSDAVIRAMTH